VYFAWILNRSGKLALFESGPGGVNGWGYDDVIGVAPMTFDQPLTSRPTSSTSRAACGLRTALRSTPTDSRPA
jgi:hypothetical protein